MNTLKTLSRHKQLIKNNKYAQELEKRYNKFRYKSQQEKIGTQRLEQIPHQWPIHSEVFTQVLRNKLDTVLKSGTPKSNTRPSTRLKVYAMKKSQKYITTPRTHLLKNYPPSGFKFSNKTFSFSSRITQ